MCVLAPAAVRLRFVIRFAGVALGSSQSASFTGPLLTILISPNGSITGLKTVKMLKSEFDG